MDEIRQIAERLKRQTTNREVLALCEHVLRSTSEKANFDRNAYQREYMRKLRAKAKT